VGGGKGQRKKFILGHFLPFIAILTLLFLHPFYFPSLRGEAAPQFQLGELGYISLGPP